MADDNVVLSPEKTKNKEYIPDPNKISETEQLLKKVRLNMLIQLPFFGQLSARLILQDATGWCPTAATDGRHFYYNVDFIEKLNPDELKFLFAHEIMHCAYDHFIRRDQRDPRLWNAAADYAINFDLVTSGIGKMPGMACYEARFKDWNAEKIYDYLYKNADKIQIPDPFDMHLDYDGDDDDDGDGSAGVKGNNYKPGDENNKPQIGKDQAEEIGEDFKNAVIQAAKSQVGNEAGNVPAGMQRLINSWTESEMDWRSVIAQKIQSHINDDFSWARYNRRGELPGGIILPGHTKLETIKIHIALDTSGSMSQKQLKDLMGEVSGIMEQFSDFEVHVWCFDAAVVKKTHKIFSSENLDEMEIYDYELAGGGGTDFMVNWRYMKEEEMEPIFFLLFTDGYPCSEWGDPNYCDTLFLVHGDDSIEAPFGLTLHYRNSDESEY